MLGPGTWVLAGTTGSLSGTITDTSTGAGIAQAKVTVTSPSQTVSTTTDSSGHFTFASLAPDTYTVSAESKDTIHSPQSGINIFADQGQTLRPFHSPSPSRRSRAYTHARRPISLKPGTTADVYSINATQQEKFAGVGGGGGLNNAYSAIATVPGAYVPNNQAAIPNDLDSRGRLRSSRVRSRRHSRQPVFRQLPIGYGVVARSTRASGFTPAPPPQNAEGQGLSGFINQVIRTGTYPGFANVDLGLGGPSYYHKASFEFGGASPIETSRITWASAGTTKTFAISIRGTASRNNPLGRLSPRTAKPHPAVRLPSTAS